MGFKALGKSLKEEEKHTLGRNPNFGIGHLFSENLFLLPVKINALPSSLLLSKQIYSRHTPFAGNLQKNILIELPVAVVNCFATEKVYYKFSSAQDEVS